MQAFYSAAMKPTGIFKEVISSEYRFALVPDQMMPGILETELAQQGAAGIFSISGEDFLVELAGFSAPQRLEDTVARWTQRICNQQGPLSLEVNNFGGIPPHVLFLRIQDLTPVRQFMANLRKLDMYLTGNGEEALKPAGRTLLMLSKTLPANRFDNLLYRLGRVEFHRVISMKSLVLQKKCLGKWTTVQQFPFSD